MFCEKKNGIFRNLLDRFTRASGSLVAAMAGSLKGILSGLVSPRLARLMGAVSATTALVFATMATSIVAVDARAGADADKAQYACATADSSGSGGESEYYGY